MPGEATILEGPVTPAPVFAYRALRSIFFASPDSSPEYHNKENIMPTYASSPTKSRPTVTDAPRLTPLQKRKRDSNSGEAILSPTKGILRTPGLATPRAKYLKDLNVKFKSVSPEVRRADTVVATNSTSNAETNGTTQAVHPSKFACQLRSSSQSRTSNTASEERVENAAQLPAGNTAPTAPSCTPLPGSVEAYMAQTEKEMKRLIRYGKKMREYALKKDAENQELKIMIEELRQQNQRLKSGVFDPVHDQKDQLLALGHEKEDGNDSDAWTRAQTHGMTSNAENPATKAVPPALRTKNQGHVRSEVDKVETTVRVHAMKNLTARGRSPSLALKPGKSAPQETSDSCRRCSSPARIISTSTTSAKPSHGAAASQQPAPAMTSIPGSSAITGPSNSGTLRLPPDRAAAARERLRQRAAARKASAGADAIPPTNNARDAHAAKDDQSRQKPSVEATRKRDPPAVVDEPSFDWANLDA
ncbi:hypothetical protein PV04_03059 [Phialophora macrospora]|uniref:Spindle pole body-associated protein cut12 domain-containing protein n=1 Tax=Phialophora macrospora TaxID=1851006 RepID=A0A0D2FWF6_9EURO|nr:hypothetical protein PV04_03059 [Phialophora macrospora]